MKFFDIERLTGCPICVCAAQERSNDGATLRTFSGWGETRQVARKKCVIEAQERLIATWSDHIHTTLASFTDLENEALDPRDILLLSSAQYQSRAQWNASVDAAHQRPAPFDPRRPIHWVQGISLSHAKKVYVPAASMFMMYPHALEEGLTEPDSNGLAAGFGPDDAVERALLEVVERDAVSIWWYNSLRKPPVSVNQTDLSSAMSDWLGSQRRELALLDLTHDFEVPVIAAISFNEQGADVSIGFGAGLSIASAIDGALGEMVQFDLTKRLARSRSLGGHLSPFLSNIARFDRRNAPFLFPKGDPESDHQATANPADLIAKFQKLAPETAVYLFGESDVCVARIVAPGLRPIWPRFAAGRLYTVPSKMGWRGSPTKEATLNPFPILY